MKLGALLDRLRSAGIVVDDGPVVFSVARDLKILRLAGPSTRQFLRILDRSKGEQDFANLQFLQGHLGSRINGPNQILASDDLTCGVFPYIPHHKVSYERLAAGGLLQEVATSLALMHEAGREFLRSGRSMADPLRFAAGADSGAIDSATGAWLESRLGQLRERHPPVAQHCDFTYANLGVTREDGLVIFDWEEYGAVTHPAFDLTTFLLGHYHFGGVIGRALDSPVALIEMINRDFGESFLGQFGLTADEYMEAFPTYLLLFWVLKLKGFSVAINRRMQSMWMRLRQAEAWAHTLKVRGH